MFDKFDSNDLVESLLSIKKYQSAAANSAFPPCLATLDYENGSTTAPGFPEPISGWMGTASDPLSNLSLN